MAGGGMEDESGGVRTGVAQGEVLEVVEEVVGETQGAFHLV